MDHLENMTPFSLGQTHSEGEKKSRFSTEIVTQSPHKTVHPSGVSVGDGRSRLLHRHGH